MAVAMTFKFSIKIMKNISIILLMSILVISCSKKEKGQTSRSGHVLVENLSPEIFLSDMYGSLYVHRAESLFIVTTLNEEEIYKVYNGKDLVGAFGSVGRGPNELSFIQPIYDSTEDQIVLFDSNYLTISKIDIHKSLAVNEIVLSSQVELPRELLGVNSIFQAYEDHLFAGMYDDQFQKRLDQKRGLFIYNDEKKNFDLFEIANFSIEPYELMPSVNINARAVAISGDRKKIVALGVHNPIMEIFDLVSNEIKEITLEGYSLTQNFDLSSFKDRTVKRYFLHAVGTHNNFYALFSGYSETDDAERFKVLVFNWEGKLTKEVVLPEGNKLSSISVDEDLEVIYGHSIDEDVIYKYYLNQ